MDSDKWYIIAVIENQEHTIMGYRIWFKGSIREVTVNDLIKVVEKENPLANAQLENGVLVGTTGSLDRYTVIVDGTPGYNSNSILLLCKYRFIQEGSTTNAIVVYKLLDYTGNCYFYTEAGLIESIEKGYIDNTGFEARHVTLNLANGKLVEKGNTKFISFLSGIYISMDLPINEMYKIGDINYSQDEYIKMEEIRHRDIAEKVMQASQYSQKRITEMREKNKVDGQIVEKFNTGVIKALKENGIKYTISESNSEPNNNYSSMVKAVDYIYGYDNANFNVRNTVNFVCNDEGIQFGVYISILNSSKGIDEYKEIIGLDDIIKKVGKDPEKIKRMIYKHIEEIGEKTTSKYLRDFRVKHNTQALVEGIKEVKGGKSVLRLIDKVTDFFDI